jgi:protein-S-isoprenylcysteine O-methyltransferase Ste14
MTRFERVFVWAGGGIFVASLVACVSWYLFVLGRSMPRGGWPPLAFDAALFSVFALHHSVFARERVKQRLAAIPPLLRRSVYVWIASLLLLLVFGSWQPIGGDFYEVTGAGAVALAAVQLAGLWIIARSVARLDPLELAGIHASPDVTPLQIGGPYRLVRHPLYLGWIVAVFGTPHMTGDRLAFAAISSIYLLMAVPWEERSLMQSFGDEYARYTRQVRWRVIPFVY